jgi:hypothetical protein
VNRVENTVYKEAEDGCLFVVDLAGSENAADSQFHDKETGETQNKLTNDIQCCGSGMFISWIPVPGSKRFPIPYPYQRI